MKRKPSKKPISPKKAKKLKDRPESDNDPLPQLTERQLLFIHHYIINGGNGTQAAISAGYSEKTAQPAASRLLLNVIISGAIRERREELAFKFEVTEDKIVQRLACIGFASMKDFMVVADRGVSLKQWEDIPDHLAGAIKAVAENETQFGTSHSIQLKDDRAALADLVKYLGLFKKGKDDTGRESDKKAFADALERLRGRFKSNK